jgi:hypothetical protein
VSTIDENVRECLWNQLGARERPIQKKRRKEQFESAGADKQELDERYVKH